MSDLQSILRGLLFFQATDAAGLHAAATTIEGDLDSSPEPAPRDASGPFAQRAIWQWSQHNASGSDPLRITNLRCWPRSMGYAMGMVVEESLRFASPRITVAGHAQPIELPLTAQYQVARYHLREGFVPGTHSLWPFQHEVDQSVALVFLYEVRPDGTLAPVTSEIWSMDGFMPDGPPVFHVPPSDTMSYALQFHFVAVVVSLVCCKEKNDFEPGGILFAGRFFPQISVISSEPLERVVASVEYQRPPSTPHHAADMDPPIRMAFYTDTNRHLARYILLPFWYDIFDYYQNTGINPGLTYTMVDWARRPRTIAAGAVEEAAFIDGGPSGHPHWLQRYAHDNYPSHYVGYVDRVFPKALGQGAFDSVHVAPSMKAWPNIVPFDPDDQSYNAPIWRDTFTSIRMAPFCEHDCVHTHWRWGASWGGVADAVAPNKRYLKGFSGDRAAVTMGAPLVPSNHVIQVTSIDVRTFRYQAEAAPVPAGTWQVVNHHGSAYSLFVEEAAGTIGGESLGGLREAIAGGNSGQWAMIYWHMRWQPTSRGPVERLHVLDLARCIT